MGHSMPNPTKIKNVYYLRVNVPADVKDRVYGTKLSLEIGGHKRLCCTNPVRDSSGESSVVAGMHEQTYTRRLQDQELASLQ